MPSSACDWSSDVCSSDRSEEHTSELQSRSDLVCRLLLEKKKTAPQLACLYSNAINRIQLRALLASVAMRAYMHSPPAHPDAVSSTHVATHARIYLCLGAP